VLDLARPSQKDVVIQVPEGQLQQIKVNDKVFVEVWALNNKIYSGHIREISPKADKITRTYITKVTLDNADENIELGMSARVRTEKVDKDVSVKLPLTAIYPLDNKTYVWVVAADMRVQLKEVEVVNDNIQDKITIHSGLENGEIVVVAGIHRLHAGQTVRLLD
jgi:membrane fusion protein, multidrug efflux system